MFRLDGKTAAITGAGSGIGAAIARTLAGQGAHVFALDVDERAADEVCAGLTREGGMSEPVRCDVSDATSVSDAFARVNEAANGLDILVNNAGIAHIGNVETTTEADMERIYAVNVKGVFLCSQAVVPAMVASGGGVILNLASIASLIGLTDRFAYSMSKGAVLTMTRSIAVDYIKQGIRCNCICPARVHTSFVDGYLRDSYPGREAEMFRCPSINRSAGWRSRRRWRRSRSTCAPTKPRSLPGRRIRSTVACWSSDDQSPACHAAPFGNSNLSSDAGCIAILNPGATGGM